MRTLKKSLILCMLLGAAGTVSAQLNMPDPTVPGSSMNNPVRLMAPSDVMVDRQIARWLRTHYPGWSADPYEIQDMGMERFAVVRISAANQQNRRVYFKLISNQNDPEARDTSFPF
jgi:hypothetical protein